MNRTHMRLQHAGWARLEAIAVALWQPVLALARAAREARVRTELRSLSDRTLRDIGLCRSDIDRLFHS